MEAQALPFTGCVSFSKSRPLAELQFPHLQTGSTWKCFCEDEMKSYLKSILCPGDSLRRSLPSGHHMMESQRWEDP